MRILVAVVFSLFVVTLSAQEIKVPTAVNAKLKALYPKAEKVTWDKEDTNLEANFKLGETEISLLFNAKGNVVEVETALEEDDLPSVIENSVKKNFKGWEINEAAKIVRDGKTTYETELEKGKKKMDAIFSDEGKLVKKVVAMEKDKKYKSSEKSGKEEKD